MKRKPAKLTGGSGWGLTRECPRCGKPETDCRCSGQVLQSLPPDRQAAVVRLEKRRGQPVTVVTGLVLSPADLREWLGELKKRCGAGGTIKEGHLEVQGDQREAVRGWLLDKGCRVKG